MVWGFPTPANTLAGPRSQQLSPEEGNRSQVEGSQSPRRLRSLKGQGDAGEAGLVGVVSQVSELGMGRQEVHGEEEGRMLQGICSAQGPGSGAQLSTGLIVPPRGYLVMFGGIFGCQCWGEGQCHGIWWVKGNRGCCPP